MEFFKDGLSKEFCGDEKGHIKSLKLAEIVWKTRDDGSGYFEEVPGTEKELPCDLALIAAGFIHPQKEGMLDQLGVELDERSNVKTKNYQTSIPKVFAAGDMRRGQSLVVWAISEGREAAGAVDEFLNGQATQLEGKNHSKLELKMV